MKDIPFNTEENNERIDISIFSLLRILIAA